VEREQEGGGGADHGLCFLGVELNRCAILWSPACRLLVDVSVSNPSSA